MPVDALFVAPERDPLPEGLDETAPAGTLGSYREAIGWGRGQTPGARIAVGPPLRHEPGDRPGPPLV